MLHYFLFILRKASDDVTNPVERWSALVNSEKGCDEFADQVYFHFLFFGFLVSLKFAAFFRLRMRPTRSGMEKGMAMIRDCIE